MPAFNFKKQFVPLIESGRKIFTIRQVRRKRPVRVGDQLFLFTGMRRKNCSVIKETKCVKLLPISITVDNYASVVSLAGRTLTPDEITTLALRDGHKNARSFLNFFIGNYGRNFQGELIEWAP